MLGSSQTSQGADLPGFYERNIKEGHSPILPALLNRNTSVALVENPDDRKDLVALGLNDERILHIPGSGVDTDLFNLSEPEGLITFGFAGRLLADKGIRTLVSAHKMLTDQVTGS